MREPPAEPAQLYERLDAWVAQLREESTEERNVVNAQLGWALFDRAHALVSVLERAHDPQVR